MAEFISLYSGSSGNSSVVRCGQRYLIVDMGKGVRTTSAALKALGLAVSDCDGILVTHEHSDHVKGLSTFLKKNTLPVYGAAATLDFLDSNGIVPASCELHELEGREEDVGAFGVQSFPTSHDVPCVGYRIHTPGRQDHDHCNRPWRAHAAGARGAFRLRPCGTGEQLRPAHAAQRAIPLLLTARIEAPGATFPTMSVRQSCWN